MMTTLIIAIIGAITGVLALILQYIEYKKSKVKLKVNLDEKNHFILLEILVINANILVLFL